MFNRRANMNKTNKLYGVESERPTCNCAGTIQSMRRQNIGKHSTADKRWLL